MNTFNGMTNIELEMMRDEIAKALPVILTLVPSFAQVVAAHYEQFKVMGYEGKEAINLAVQAAGKQMGFN